MIYRLIPLAMAVLLTACQRAPDPGAEGNAAIAALPTPAPLPGAVAEDLTGYIGHYPIDTVAGSSFLAEPAVHALVAGTVPDPAVRERVLDRELVSTPIVRRDDQLLSFGCEPHDCGSHNWTIAIRPDGSGGAVCHYDRSRNIARWYPAGAGEPPIGGCPGGDE